MAVENQHLNPDYKISLGQIELCIHRFIRLRKKEPNSIWVHPEHKKWIISEISNTHNYDIVDKDSELILFGSKLFTNENLLKKQILICEFMNLDINYQDFMSAYPNSFLEIYF